MESGSKRSRKSKLVPRDIADSDDEIVELQNEVERTLSQYKCVPAKARPPAPPPAKPLSPPLPTTSAPPMAFSVKVEVENVDEDVLVIEKAPPPVCDDDGEIKYEDIIRESEKIMSNSYNICDKILHIQVLNTCEVEPIKFTKSNQVKLLDKALLRWRDWACFTEENKEPPLFYKCYVCYEAWWHLHEFREHLNIHRYRSLRINIEINDYVECNIVAYVDRSEKSFIDLDGKCWRCGGIGTEHVKPKHCLGCNRQMYTCTKLQEHQWYCEKFKRMHIKLFQKATKIFKCHLCRMYYFNSEDLLEHMVLKHSVRSDLPMPGYNVMCQLCKSASVHTEHVCSQIKFQECCQLCKKRFADKTTAAIHRYVWKNSKICPIFTCKAKLKRECMLSDHVSTHTDNYCLAYRCLACPKLVLLEPTKSKYHTLTEHKDSYFSVNYSPYDPIYIPMAIANKLKNFNTDFTPEPVKIHVKSKVSYSEGTSPDYQSLRNRIEIHKNISQTPQEVIQNDLSIVKTEPNDIEYMDVDDDVMIVESYPETIDLQSIENQTNDDEIPCVIYSIKTELDIEKNYEPVITNIKSEPIDKMDDKNVENNDDNTIIDPKEIEDDLNCNEKPKVIKTYCRKRKVLQKKNNDVETPSASAGKTQNINTEIASKPNTDDEIIDGSQNLLNSEEIKKECDVLAQENCSVMHKVTNCIESVKDTTIDESLINDTSEKNIHDKLKIQGNVSEENKNTMNEEDANHNLENVQNTIDNVNKSLNETDNTNKDTQNKTVSNVENGENTEMQGNGVSDTITVQNANIQINMTYDKDLQIKKEPLTETESNLKLADIKKIYHIDVNLSADSTNNINVKQEINEIDMSGRGENTWELCSGVFGNFNEVQQESDEEFLKDLIIIEPKLEVDSPSEQQNCPSEPEDRDIRNRKRKLYKCNQCSFQGYHKPFIHHKRDSCPRQERKRQEFSSYACSKCLIRFKNLRLYLRHFKEHDYPRLACPQCLHVSLNMFNLEMHVFAHVKSMFVTYRAINSPQETRKCAYRCKVCEEHVLKKQFFEHWDSHMELRDWKEVDTEGLVSKSRDPGIEKIIELFTNTDKLTDRGRKNFRTCVICDREFHRRNDCKRHMIEHLLTDAYKMKFHFPDLRCQICEKGFQKTEWYRSHMRNHASLPVYKCEICNKTFSDSSNFSKHKKVHNFSILICDICSKKFNNKLYLIRHLKFHETTKPIKCEHCERIFYSNSLYRKHHQNAHEPTIPRFKCRQCDLNFLSLKEKWDHMWNLHKERKTEADCPLCSAKFRKMTDVKRHLEKEHNSPVKETRNVPGSKPKTYPPKQT